MFVNNAPVYVEWSLACCWLDGCVVTESPQNTTPPNKTSDHAHTVTHAHTKPFHLSLIAEIAAYFKVCTYVTGALVYAEEVLDGLNFHKKYILQQNLYLDTAQRHASLCQFPCEVW